LAKRPEDWKWSSFRHYVTGVEGVVEIESEWTARKRERTGIAPVVRQSQNPRPVSPKPGDTRTGHPEDHDL
jgi:putative transposase